MGTDKRHAYLILAHHHFGQLRKLISLLDDPRNDIYVHVDRKAEFNPEEWKRLKSEGAMHKLSYKILKKETSGKSYYDKVLVSSNPQTY